MRPIEPFTETARRRMHRVLALAPAPAVHRLCAGLCDGVQAVFLRGPETGMVMARGRIGGAGALFNLGDVSLTRASLRLDDGRVGHAAHLGRDQDKARMAAIVDALWQDPARRDAIEGAIIAPLERLVADQDRQRSEETEATKVDFFTLVRGED